MNDLMPDPVDVLAPAGALGWSASRGFIDSPGELFEAQGEGEVVLDVDDDQVLRDVEGDAPLAVTVRHDRELTDVRRVTAGLAVRVSDLGDRAAGLDTGLATEVAALKARVRRLEGR